MERSIEYARRQGEHAGTAVDYIMGDYLETTINSPLDLITMISCDFSALAPGQRRKLLLRIGALLASGGRFVFDINSYAGFDAREESVVSAPNLMDGFWSPDPCEGSLYAYRYPEAKVTLDRYDIVGSGSTTPIYNWVQYYDVGRITIELAAVGFEIQDVLGDVAGSPFDAAATAPSDRTPGRSSRGPRVVVLVELRHAQPNRRRSITCPVSSSTCRSICSKP